MSTNKPSEAVMILQLKVGDYKNFSYIVADAATGEAAVIDPAWEVQLILEKLKERNLNLKFIVNTHAHLDHIEGNASLSSVTGAKIVMHANSYAKKDIAVKDGGSLKVGKNAILHFIHTPGHSSESMCIIVNDIAIFTGDTLFVGECGRVDLPGGDANALYDSFEKLRSLDPKLALYPGHDYGNRPVSTLGEEIRSNYTLAKRTREEFVKFMLNESRVGSKEDPLSRLS